MKGRGADQPGLSRLLLYARMPSSNSSCCASSHCSKSAARSPTEFLSYRFVATSDSTSAFRLERLVQGGALDAGKPILNPR
jgi:hypothetical protein